MTNKYIATFLALTILAPMILPVVFVIDSLHRANHPIESKPVATAIEMEAEQSAREYSRRLASLCRQQAAKADDFKSYAELFDFGHAGEVDARHAFEAFENQLTKTINPADPYKPAAVRQAFAEAARGFDAAAGSHKDVK